MNPYVLAAAILGAWFAASVPTALILGIVIARRDRRQ